MTEIDCGVSMIGVLVLVAALLVWTGRRPVTTI
jgi:hypothetical protein